MLERITRKTMISVLLVLTLICPAGAEQEKVEFDPFATEANLAAAKNISARQLLNTVITMAGFVYHRDGDVFTVMTYDEYMQYRGLAKQIFKLKFAPAASVDATLRLPQDRETNCDILS
jgi:hypothetical protein